MGILETNNQSKAADLPNHFVDLDEIGTIFSIVIIKSDFNIKYINSQFSKDFGYTSDDLLGQSIDHLNAGLNNGKNDQINWRSFLSHQLSVSIQLVSKADNATLCKLKVIEKDNGDFWLLFDLPELVGNSIQKLQESVNLHLQLINNSPDIICFKEGEGRWLLANESNLELFQLNGVDYKGKTDQELAEYTHKIYRDAFLTCMETDERCWQEGKMSRNDELINKPDGSKIVLDVIKIPIFNKDGSRKNLIVLGRDVTARRNAVSELVVAKKRAEESDKLKSNFLASMSHELRTPLNAIIGFANLIYEEQYIDEIHEYARIINNNSKMLLNLIEDVFDVSLIESDQIQIDQKEFDLIQAITEVFEIFPMELNMLDKIDIELKLLFNKQSYLFKGDEFRIKQILTNLIRNALKFTNEGFIHIQLDVLEKYIDIKVIDSGIGISEEKMQEIFGLFRQVEEGYKRSFGGAGLGLSISKKLANMMKGDILVESELHKGSTFTLRLPID